MTMEADRKTYELSKEQHDFYHENGYLVVQNLISGEEADRLLESIAPHADKDFAAIMNADREEELARQAPHSSPESVTATSKLFRNYLKDSRLVSVLEALQGREVVGLMSQMLFKWVGTPYALQAWNPHQDNTYPRNANKQYITTNLFFGDADRENGSLYIYPGSHNEDLLPSKPTVSYREEKGSNPGNTVDVPNTYSRVDLSFKKGDLVVLNGNTIHGSYPNLSKTRSRPLFSCSYISKGEDFIPGESARRRVIPLH
ncbi:MAG: phytanoyl-CoA dioxygenase family protein [Candidatus Omnitrophota bacterium]|nr:phytanoyl-CoA dioxygenase family protein [Candidatus Omnitrophota bacterium]